MTFKCKLLLAHLLIGCYIITIYSGHQHVLAKVATDTVHVAPPTGERETDRASILAALEVVKPGGTVQLAAGMYLMGGEIIRITVPRITLAGHAEGTTLRGCYPDEFPMHDSTEFGNNCNGLELAGEWQTVRDLTFEHAFWALHVGCCWESQPHMMSGEGGHLIEGNTFSSNSNAVRVHGYWSEPTVIRNNRLLNNWHSITVYGNTAHILNNSISAPDPEEVQLTGFPADGIHIGHPMSLHESAEGVTRTCENNIVSGNRIDGVTEGIMVSANDREIICRNNVIRDNTIIIRRAHPPTIPGFIRIHDEEDSTVVGVPIALRGVLEDNLIEENIIHRAEGLAIEIRGASRNRIINNTITDVEQRNPFPGNAIAALPVIGGDPESWREANGSGIWLSPGSNGNEITGNSFEDIASYTVFVEGDSNRVEMRNLEDKVRDLGSGNQIHLENDKDIIRSADQCMEETILTYIEEIEIPGATLLIMKDGRTILEESYGRASLELDVDVTPSTLFPYASIAKIFTGTAILRLVQNGVFSLDDSITERIPNLPGEWSGVTVRHLLSNTSGLPDLNEGRRFENPFIAPKMSWDEILENLTNRQVDFEPGEGYSYNQTNYALLGMLIEQTDGRKIEEYVREEFAAIYGLESLHYGDARDAIPGRTTGYTHFDFNLETPQLGPIRPLWIEYPHFLYAGAGLNGTALDIARFVEAIESGQILEEEYKQEMWSASKLADGTIFRFDNSRTGTGLGWWVHDDPENPYVAMSGGSSATIRHYLNDSLTVVVLTNLQGSQPEKLVNNLTENCL